MEKLHRADEELLDEELARPRRVPGRASPAARIMRAARGLPDHEIAEQMLARAARSGGMPLPERLRAMFSRALGGADLSGVRIHTGADSAAAAKAVGARAYAVGQDIHFAAGEYDPQGAFGVHLIAHEVAHTVQQAGGGSAPAHDLEISSPTDSLEHEADRAADAMITGEATAVSEGPAIAARTPTAASAADASEASSAQNPAGPAGGGGNSAPAEGADSGGGDASETATGKVVVVVNFTAPAGTPIAFAQPDYLSFYKAVADRAATGAEAGSCECGTIDQDVKTLNDNVTNATYTVPISTSLPSWSSVSQASPADQASYKAWLASVTAHENQHAKIFRDGYGALKGSVIGPKEADAKKQFDKVDADVTKAQKAFDAANQPAALAAPSGVTKVP